jgi:hypothetical protein
MIEMLKQLLWNETAFIRYMRAGLVLFGALATQQIPGMPPWVGPTSMAVGVFLGAGDKNPKPTS